MPNELDLTVGRKCYNTSYYGIWGRNSCLSSSPPERREVLLSWKTLWYVWLTFAEGRTDHCLAHAADNRTWGIPSSTSGSNPWLHWIEVDLFPGSSWSLSALKQQWTSTFLNGWLLNSGNWTGFTCGTLALRSFIYQDVGVPTCHPCSTTGMYAGLPLLSAMSNLGHLSTCGNRYVVVKRY